MAGIFDIADIPDWMNPTRNIIDTGKTMNPVIAQNFSSAFRESQAQAAKIADRNNQQQQIIGKFAPIAKQLQGASTPEVAWDIVSKNPQWLADPQTAPGIKNYLAGQAEVAKAEVGSIAGKIAISDSTDFTKRMATILPEERAAIGGMSTNPNGTPSALQWQALRTAEQTTALHKQNEMDQATIDAQARGDVPTTTINDKGVSTKYAPPSQSGKAIVPQEMSLSDGSKIAFNPKTGSFKYLPKTGKEQDFTHAQLLNVAKAGLQVDSGNTNSLNIIKWLEDKAISQTQGSADLTNSTKSGLKYNIVPLK